MVSVIADDPSTRPGTVHRHKARRAHTCAECEAGIQPGEEYMFLNTFDRGKWGRYILCSACERILSCHRFTELSLSCELPHAHGRLRDEVKGHFQQSRAYKEAFNEAWEMSEPGGNGVGFEP